MIIRLSRSVLAVFAAMVFAMLAIVHAPASAQSAAGMLPPDARAAAIGKLDAGLKMQVGLGSALAGPSVAGPWVAPRGERLVPVFVLGDVALATAAIERAGGSIGSGRDGILTANIPFSKLLSVAAEPSVLRMEGAGAVKPYDDSLHAAIGADMVHAGAAPLTRGYTGKGVIVGVIDVGFDINHREFRDRLDTGRTRFIRIWSQGVDRGPHPEGYSYGSEWTAEEIQSSIASDSLGVVPKEWISPFNHGTHVAGIAAGVHGVAPDADIIGVQVNADLEIGQPFTTQLLDAARYIFEQATRLGRPCVINVSLGDEVNAHDGSDLLSQGLDKLMAASAGRVLCAGAGNSGLQASHWGGFGAEHDSLWTYAFNVGAYLRVPDSALSTFEISVVVDDDYTADAMYAGQTPWRTVGAIRSATGVVADTVRGPDGEVVQIVNIAAAPAAAGHTELRITFGVGGIQRCRINVRGGGWFHMWSAGIVPPQYVTDMSWDRGDRFREPDRLYDVGRPAIARNVIAVGSSVNRTSYVDVDGNIISNNRGPVAGELSVFSSRGPSADERVKPDIVAPGEYVISARAALGEAAAPDEVWGEDTTMIVLSGTSMASPVVTGAVALFLEKNPHATFSQIRQVITTTARRDAATASNGPLPNGHWGYGKLDIFAALTSFASGVPSAGRAPWLFMLR